MTTPSLLQDFSEVKSEVAPLQRKTPRAEGSSGGWLSDLGVKPGEFQYETTARLRRMAEMWPAERGRVWACLSLHSLGFRQEVAVKLVNGRLEPLTRADIARETGLSQAHVRRALVALENEGWIERASLSESGKLLRGEIAIRVFVAPRPARFSEPIEGEPAARPELDIPDTLPAILVAWARRRKRAAVLVGLGQLESERLVERAHTLEQAEAGLEAAFEEIIESRAQSVTGPRANPIEPVEKPAHGAARRYSRSRAQEKTADLNLKEDKVRDKASKQESTTRETPLPACLADEMEPIEKLRLELTRRGVLEDRALGLVKNLAPDEALAAIDRLDWCDFEVARRKETRRPFDNPAGFYFSTIKKRAALPADWETLSMRREREQTRQLEQQATGERAAAEIAEMEAHKRYDAFIAAQADADLATLPEATVKRRFAAHMERIQVEAPQYHWPLETLRSFALQALRLEIARESGDLPNFEEWRAMV